MVIRPRTSDDLDACVTLLQIVREQDGYPVHLPPDVTSFVASSDADAAWVAEHEGRVVGHVALHRRSSAAVIALASATLDLPADRIRVVARLFVAPGSRRMGLGRALLARAAGAALDAGCTPVLDVVVTHLAAIDLYDASGWRRLGAVTAAFRDGTELGEIVFVGPDKP
jgi:GNAT superfamily N-acetyltransferase